MIQRKVLININNIRKLDAVLLSYPKSGNTWLRFIFANILNEIYSLTDKITFDNIEKFIPVINKNKKLEKYHKLPLIVKKHFFPKIEKIYFHLINKKIVFIVRNPLDVLKSYYLYSINVRNKQYESFNSFIKSDRGIEAWIRSLNQYYYKSEFILYYDLLIQNDKNEIEKIIKIFDILFNIRINNEIIARSFEICSKSNMRKLEEDRKKKSKYLISNVKIVNNYSFISLTKRRVKINDNDFEYINKMLRNKLNDKIYKVFIDENIILVN